MLAVGKYLLPKNRADVLIALRSKGMRSLPSPRVQEGCLSEPPTAALLSPEDVWFRFLIIVHISVYF